MMRRLLTLLILLLAACDAPPADMLPTAFPFPTMTPGRVLNVPMPTMIGVPLDGSGLANPATAVALSNRPTATPNLRACPASDPAAMLDPVMPPNAAQIDDAIARYLNAGGNADNLAVFMEQNWNVFGETGFARGDLDLTGEGTPEIVVGYRAPDSGGNLLVFGCLDGRYLTRYEAALGGDAPQMLTIGDLNLNGAPELLFGGAACADADTCVYTTQMLTWSVERGRFVNLLSGAITSDSAPTVEDIDADQIGELIIRMEDSGDSETGPLRTGFTVYDWDGASYVRSITQLSPPRFRIQVLHDADAEFRNGNADQAVALYNLAVDSPGLENWYPDEAALLLSYARYRLLIAYAFTEDPRLLATYQAILAAAPDPAAAPVYDALSQAFWNAYQVTHNLNSACLEVQAIIAARPDAVSLLNRYGSRSPTYAPGDLCPF
jgi:hypothetical protein